MITPLPLLRGGSPSVPPICKLSTPLWAAWLFSVFRSLVRKHGVPLAPFQSCRRTKKPFSFLNFFLGPPLLRPTSCPCLRHPLPHRPSAHPFSRSEPYFFAPRSRCRGLFFFPSPPGIPFSTAPSGLRFPDSSRRSP